MFNIAHLSKFVVNFNFIMMFKPKFIILTGLSFKVVASSSSHFYSFFFVNVLARVTFDMATLAFGQTFYNKVYNSAEALYTRFPAS